MSLTHQTQFSKDLDVVVDEVKKMLLEKNANYGNSALEPVRIFSKSDPLEGIRVRIDDKLNRLMNQKVGDQEDTELDLIGYLIIYRIAKLKNQNIPMPPNHGIHTLMGIINPTGKL